MKVKTLLKLLNHTEYWLVSESDTGLENGFVYGEYDYSSKYEDCTVKKVWTVQGCDCIFIMIRQG